MQFLAASMPDVQREIMNLRFPRTVDGMRSAVLTAEKYKRKFYAHATIARLKRDDRLTQQSFILPGPADGFGLLAQACEVLSGCLHRGDLEGITVVGDVLGRSLTSAHQPMLEAETIFRSLLDVNATNPIHPWQREL